MADALEGITITEHLGDDGVTIEVAGELDLTTAPDLKTRLDALIDGGAEAITLDLSGIEFIDSSGLRVLLATRSRLDDKSGEGLRLRSPSGATTRVLEVAGLADAFPIV